MEGLHAARPKGWRSRVGRVGLRAAAILAILSVPVVGLAGRLAPGASEAHSAAAALPPPTVSTTPVLPPTMTPALATPPPGTPAPSADPTPEPDPTSQPRPSCATAPAVAPRYAAASFEPADLTVGHGTRGVTLTVTVNSGCAGLIAGDGTIALRNASTGSRVLLGMSQASRVTTGKGTPAAVTTLRFRMAVGAGDSGHWQFMRADVRSPQAALRLAPASATTLAVRVATRTSITARGSARVGQRLHPQARLVAPAGAGWVGVGDRGVRLQVKAPGRRDWHTFASARTALDGHAVAQLRFAKPGTYRLRAVYAGGPLALSSSSGVQKVVVRR